MSKKTSVPAVLTAANGNYNIHDIHCVFLIDNMAQVETKDKVQNTINIQSKQTKTDYTFWLQTLCGNNKTHKIKS